MWEFSFRWRRRTVLLVRPDPKAIGHLAYETKYAISAAAQGQALLYLIRAPGSINPAIFDLEFPGVERLQNRAWIDRPLHLWIETETAWRKYCARREMARRMELRRLRRDASWRQVADRRRALGLGHDAVWTEREIVWRRRLRSARIGIGRALLDCLIEGRLGRLMPKSFRDPLREARKRHSQILKNAPDESAAAPFMSGVARLGNALRLPALPMPAPPLRILPPDDLLYYRRDLMVAPHVARCSAEMARRGDEISAALGLAPDAPIVTVHVRTGGFKGAKDLLIKERVAEDDSLRDETARNADIRNYFAAFDWLVEQGYRIVRLGDPSMPPVDHPGVVDLAHAANREPLLDFYFIGRSRFMLGSDSGPTVIAWLMGTPVAYLNASSAAICWPFGARDLVVPKYVRDRETGHFLSLEAQLQGRPVSHFKDTRLFDYVELTPDDILSAVRELSDRLAATQDPAEDALQRRFREACIAFLEDPERPNYFQKWGCRNRIIGHGTVARFVVARNAGGVWNPQPASAHPSGLRQASG